MTYGFKVTEVKMKISENKKYKATCNITINGMLAINDIQLVENEVGNLTINMPNRRLKNGEYENMVRPMNAETRSIIEDAIYSEYNRIMNLK